MIRKGIVGEKKAISSIMMVSVALFIAVVIFLAKA